METAVDLKQRTINSIEKMLDIAIFATIPCIAFSRAFVEICAAVVSILWILLAVIERKNPVKENWLFWPAAVYLLTHFVSSVRSAHLFLTMREFLSIAEYVVFFLAVADRFRNAAKIKKAFQVFVITVLVVVVDGYFQYFFRTDFLRLKTIGDIMGQPRVTAAFNHPNSLGAFLMVGTLIITGVLFKYVMEKRKVLVSFAAVLLFAAFYVMILTYSRGAWLGFFVGILIFAIMREWRLLPVVAVLLLSGYFILPESVMDRFKSFVSLNDGSIADRISAWKYAVKMIAENPLFGSGLKTFSLHYGKGYTHNCYLQMAVETGLSGVMSFLVLVLYFLWRGARRYCRISTSADAPLLLGVLAAVAAFMVQSFVDNNYYSIPLAVGFWFVLAIGAVLAKTEPANSC